MTILKRFTMPLAVLAVALTASFAFVGDADARRGGSFGSRGVKTFSTPAATPTAPNPSGSVQRSMTQPGQAAAPAAAAASKGQRGGLFGGLGGSILGGLALGGLIGMMFGGGFGGLAGGLGMLLQLGLIALAVMFAVRFFASRRQPAAAGAAPAPQGAAMRENLGGSGLGGSGFGGFGFGGASAKPARPANARNDNDEVGILDSDLEAFERRLDEVQSAFAREDYAGLRAVTTPEIMSYLSEELSQNATSGLRNDVTDVKLLQGDLAEAWREGDTDYATVAMRYESRDVMRDRATGDMAPGAVDEPTETTEIWTFSRRNGEAWKLSAIQET